METDWTSFLLPYKKTTSELKSKFISLQEEYKLSGQHVPIESVTARVKPRESIIEKMNRRNILEKNLDVEMEDIAGIRVMCQFVDDIYQLVEVIRKRSDLVVIEERDYIANEKESGYRSYHLIIKYPVQLLIGQKEILAEIQIRTLAMNFWATIEHSLNYKYKGKFPE
ncbi:GTP pyrophosphokinase [Liquorilactobacillus cacaonum DSM 21116]|uniref:GTP pyrophosphokinase n=1 Tax=Liquorilactobacillus cacaonum DSM 21116 TaxID=1423729 RepID=A0A0R2CK65_9LACO|nr:GTP pyrophosphokinase [Liquorilactobacillus cacaonum DSM 21116]